MSDSNCIFCKIVAGDMPCFKIHEDEHTLTFLDLFPAARGHALIITRDHWPDIFPADPEKIAAVARNAVWLSRAMDEVLQPDGLGLHQLNRPAAGQTVFHYHQHLIPATAGKPPELHGRQQGDEAELSALAKELSAALAALRA